MTAPTTPSPERQPADAGGEEARRNIQQLAKMQREQAGWANKIGQPGCGARLEASDNAEALAWAVKVLTASAPQAQPDARAWLVQEFNHDGVLRSEFAVVGDQPWSGERGADQITTQPLYLSAPAADDGWRPSREEVARIVDPTAWAFYDEQIVNPIMGAECRHEVRASLAKADAILALHPAAPTDEVGKS